MQRYGANQVAAFDTLYARHKDALYRYLLRGCGIPAVAAELAQDVWSRVIEARSRYLPSARFTTWLYQIAHHRLIDYVRARRPETSDEAALDGAAAHESQRPDHRAVAADCTDRLFASLALLPLEQRELVLLKQEGDLTLEEMATIQGVGRETAKSRLRYALDKLKEALGDCLE